MGVGDGTEVRGRRGRRGREEGERRKMERFED